MSWVQPKRSGLEKDKLKIADIDYVVRTYFDYLYRVDQRSRAKDIEAALRLMVPGQAKTFAQYLTEQKVLQTQREQQWNAGKFRTSRNQSVS